ncbi:acyl carrier protein [Streptomyces chumphonensis]|uniref:acyl carrier protein n=1 Tax=Streptomyces chumphonensis TaxID=1214925 RepID=UPI003D7028AE
MYEQLKTILITDLHVAEDDVRPEATREEAGLDSLAMVELSMAIGKRLGLDVSDDELLEAATVGELARLVEERAAHTARQASNP